MKQTKTRQALKIVAAVGVVALVGVGATLCGISSQQDTIESLNAQVAVAAGQLNDTASTLLATSTILESANIQVGELTANVDLLNAEAVEQAALNAEQAAEILALGAVEPVEVVNYDAVRDVLVDYPYDEDDETGVDLLDDLKDDEVTTEIIADRAVAVIDAINLAEQLAGDAETLVEYIDDEEDIFGRGDLKEFRDNDVYRVTVDNDNTIVEVEDFDDKEFTIFVEAKMKLDNDDDKETVRVIAEVEVEDGVAEIVNVELK